MTTQRKEGFFEKRGYAPCAGCASCAGGQRQLGIDLSKWDFVVALAGNPNTGKSTVFNAITGLHQHTGNWPGKTVARAEGALLTDVDGNKLTIDFDDAGRKRVVDSFVERA